MTNRKTLFCIDIEYYIVLFSNPIDNISDQRDFHFS